MGRTIDVGSIHRLLCIDRFEIGEQVGADERRCRGFERLIGGAEISRQNHRSAQHRDGLVVTRRGFESKFDSGSVNASASPSRHTPASDEIASLHLGLHRLAIDGQLRVLGPALATRSAMANCCGFFSDATLTFTAPSYG